ncbi:MULTISPECIES: Ppx/GppA phosphatase family protein [Hydrogenophaga]|uniref:Ppx/GppA phosphatase family protein n=1 Tax=Hydrogenophaga TaxID=47420 RepID=UPI001CF988E6|nr:MULTISPECIES: Ppx/GppA phosphatase family protein [Hydrogenophaga]MDO9028928.1 Ppx/GppA phosphatase family protein [Hydrogenophaga sp.]MDP2020582.1 Ppx/GppA phosphatase family protein [Hydrogenophaga sp.]UCU96821.1 Ppx/GppA family phosphatase [Hydrogenophaga taeniospiralis]
MQNGTLLAAIDLGSNSFRLEIGRFHSGHIERVEYIKETVRQGNGLDENKVLSEAAMQRGWDCLARFAERLHGFKKQQVRAVATQTLREAQNRDEFMRKAQSILGFAIEVVSGHEEARLIYQGVSRLLPQSEEKRLVVDIGGRSTEMILGQGYEARKMESYRLGSVAWSTKYFPRGQLTTVAFKTAEVAAKAVLDEALDTFPPSEWTVSYGSSGTVGSVADILAANGWASGVVTRSGLDWLVDKLIKAGNVDNLRIEGMKDDRRAVLGGGVSVLRAIFDLFDIQQMLPAQGALRQGALYDLIDRESHEGDVRERTVRWLAERFSIDEAQAQRVSTVSTALFAQIAAADTPNERYSQKLAWAARLHEIGTHISHDRSYHHGAYILDNVDAPGFSFPELHRMSQLVLGQRGKLRKLEQSLEDELFAKQLMSLRLAVLLCHARQMPEHQSVKLSYKSGAFKLATNPGWSRRYPQSAWLLGEEVLAWQKTAWKFSADLR